MSDEEEGASGVVATRHPGRVNPIEHCRSKSGSAWLHFPHVELMFLFFAFEGAVASQVAVIHEWACPEVVVTAIAALVSIHKEGGQLVLYRTLV